MTARYVDVLVALRRIMRAADLYSQRLRRSGGLTTPQLLVLQAAERLGELGVGRIAQEVRLSQATVTTIVDRLEARGLLVRDRSAADRRRVQLRLTEAGSATLEGAPPPLQQEFLQRFSALPQWEQSMIAAALQRTAALMDAEELDASPMLLTGEITQDATGARTDRTSEVDAKNVTAAMRPTDGC